MDVDERRRGDLDTAAMGTGTFRQLAGGPGRVLAWSDATGTGTNTQAQNLGVRLWGPAIGLAAPTLQGSTSCALSVGFNDAMFVCAGATFFDSAIYASGAWTEGLTAAGVDSNISYTLASDGDHYRLDFGGYYEGGVSSTGYSGGAWSARRRPERERRGTDAVLRDGPLRHLVPPERAVELRLRLGVTRRRIRRLRPAGDARHRRLDVRRLQLARRERWLLHRRAVHWRG